MRWQGSDFGVKLYRVFQPVACGWRVVVYLRTLIPSLPK